jgi:hypothetical protein
LDGAVRGIACAGVGESGGVVGSDDDAACRRSTEGAGDAVVLERVDADGALSAGGVAGVGVEAVEDEGADSVLREAEGTADNAADGDGAVVFQGEAGAHGEVAKGPGASDSAVAS